MLVARIEKVELEEIDKILWKMYFIRLKSFIVEDKKSLVVK